MQAAGLSCAIVAHLLFHIKRSAETYDKEKERIVQKVLFVSAQKWENGIREKQQQRRTTTTWEVGDGSCRLWRRERGGSTIFNLGWQNPNRQQLMFSGVITTSVAKQRARRRKEEEEEEVSLSSQVRGVET